MKMHNVALTNPPKKISPSDLSLFLPLFLHSVREMSLHPANILNLGKMEVVQLLSLKSNFSFFFQTSRFFVIILSLSPCPFSLLTHHSLTAHSDYGLGSNRKSLIFQYKPTAQDCCSSQKAKFKTF